jgi:ferrous iron transport protein B
MAPGSILCKAVVYHYQEKSFFILNLPVYRSPRWEKCFNNHGRKGEDFCVFDAGKVIMVISLLLWY